MGGILIKRTVADAAKEISPPALITTASFMGVSFQDWVYILTAIYAAVQLLRTMPKIIGCGRCFWINKTCQLTCRDGGGAKP